MPGTDLPGYIFHLSYLGIFLWFAFIEQVTPVPEEVSLITLGYISIHTGLNPFICGVVSAIGLLTTDNLLYYLSLKGKKLSRKLFAKPDQRLVSRIKQNLHDNPKKTLIIMALLPKLRFLSPIVSATSGISWKIFLYVNSVVTVFYVCVYMLLGILFQHQLQAVFQELEMWQHIIFSIVMIAVAVLIILRIRKMMKEM